MPLDSRIGFGAKVLTSEKSMKNSDAVEVKPVPIRPQMLKKTGKRFGGSKGPKLFFPFRDLGPNLFVGSERMLKSRADVASVDAGDDRSIRVMREFPKGSGKNRFRRSFARRCPCLHGGLEPTAEDGKDGEGAAWKKEIA